MAAKGVTASLTIIRQDSSRQGLISKKWGFGIEKWKL